MEHISNLEEPQAISSKGLTLEKSSYYIILAIAFLLPIFFIPSISFPFQFGKILIVALGTFLSFSLWIIARLRSGEIELPTSFPFLTAFVILLITLISAIFSGVVTRSFIGLGFETDTFFFVLTLFLLMFMASVLFRSKERMFSLYRTLSISLAVLLIFQFLRLFVGADFLAFGVLTNTTSSLLGKWSDLAIVSGLYALISIVALEFFRPSMIIKGFLYLFLVLSLIFMVIVNSLMSWLVLGILSLVLLVFLISNNKSSQQNWTIAKLPIILILVSLVFILARGPIGDFVSGRLGITQLEARPSLQSTWEIAKNTLPDNPGFGAGPNRFSSEWGMFKSIEVNNTIFWNVDFNFGVGIIPTNLVTTGILGFLAWIVFLGSLLFLGARALFVNLESNVSRFLITSSFLATIFLWVFSVISVPGTVVLALTFLMTGAFFATMSKEGQMEEKRISFGENSKVSFISVFFLIVILIVNIAFGYLIVTRYISATYFQKTLVSANVEGDIDKAGGNMNRAILFAKTDRNYRLLSQLHIANLNNLLGQEDLSQTEDGRAQFQGILGSAIASAQEAARLDRVNYQNWLALGNIYEAIVPIGIEGSYESAKTTYERAQKENPTNPSVDLVLARLEVANEDNDKARELIAGALIKKNDYTEAIFLLSQIEINEGNIDGAISSVETASLITPNDPIVFFQLGFLKYNEGDFDGAVRALERAVGLNPPYSNAKYFLGLSYYNVGRNEEAIQQFEDVEFLNPDNSEVKAILENLKAGEAPLPDVEEAPEDRETLPVEN